MRTAIIDCYTDEPAGLGVPPYLGVYPRYIYGSLEGEKYYLTIDDLRLWWQYRSKIPSEGRKTNIYIKNLTKNYPSVENILNSSNRIVVILGVHTPGKYLSAVPGTIEEIIPILKKFKAKKILTGPAASEFGSELEGGKKVSKKFNELINQHFDYIIHSDFNDSLEEIERDYSQLKSIAIKGTEIVKQIPYEIIAEIETSRGCSYGQCSFCTDALKYCFESRKPEEVKFEIDALKCLGVQNIRLGKQSCFYSYPGNIKLLKSLSGFKVLHIDNVNPVKVLGKKGEEITKAIVQYCTPGNVAAFGVESFDPGVIKANKLNSNPEITLEAIKIINHFGAERGSNGLPKFLPGINILFGLESESRKTHECNMFWLNKILDSNLLIRRINIRQVVPYPGTRLYDSVGDKFLRKNRKYYWKWRNEIRQKIDLEMLKRLVPLGTIMKDVKTEIYDGNTTFSRQFGTYPLIVGVKKRLELDKYINIRVTSHMLRSIVGEVA